jgi:hypothetical protein
MRQRSRNACYGFIAAQGGSSERVLVQAIIAVFIVAMVAVLIVAWWSKG